MIRATAAVAAVTILGCALLASSASANRAMAHRNEITALFTIDHGWRPVSDYDLRTYNREFHRILGSCKINAENLTNTMLFLAYKASDQGQRYVTSLMMMKAVTRRITWNGQASCRHTFDLAEGHMEAGGP